MKEKICVYAICKNESKFIDRWVNSLKEADKIVVLDTGSTDDSIEKLKKYKPLVEVHQKIFHPFNFDDARNESMKYIPEDTTICVVADLDQVFQPGWSKYLKEDFEKGYDEVYGPILDYEPVTGEAKSFLSRNVHRYEKNEKHWSWVRHIHEGVYYDGDESESNINEINRFVDNRFVIEHHPDKTKSRIGYLDILKREYEEKPNDPYTAIYYGCELAYHGQNEESLNVFIKAINECDFSIHNDIGYQICINIANDFAEYKKYDEALKYAYKAEEYGIYTRRLYMTQARIEKLAKHYINAVKLAQKAYTIVNDSLNWMDDRNWYNSNVIEDFIKDCNKNITKVCVYTICKNEESNILNWYDSVKDADFICVIDTGSTDSTLNILKDLAKNYYNFYYEDYSEYFKNHRFSFADARNKSLDTAKNYIMDLKDPIDNWVFVSLDLDEFLEENGIEKIRSNWTPELYDVMQLKAITPNQGSQFINSKIHSSNKNWNWKRMIHEIISNKDKPESKWNVMIPDPAISYTHKQDTTKKRDYYKLLKMENVIENSSDSKTLIYLGWEALNHNEYKDAVVYYKKCYDIITMIKDDENFQNYQYMLQCCIAIIKYSPTFDKNLFKYYAQAIKEILDGNLFPDNRRSRDCLAYYFFKSNDYMNCIKQLKLELAIKERPLCWVDHDEFYTDEFDIYYHIANCYDILYQDTPDDSYISNALVYIDKAVQLSKDNSSDSIIKLADKIRKEYRDSFQEFANVKHEGKNKICVYAITKNESKFVEKWVNSMKEADSIVVLDTGSTDDTVEKLKSLGVTVKSTQYEIWRFDIARNDALRLVPNDCNILISTDLDEVLEPGWADTLRNNWIEGKHQRAEYKYTWSHLPNGEDGRVFTYNKIHSRNWIWKYPVHELLININNDSENYPRDEALNLFNSIHLHHYPDQTKSRASYLPLLELRAHAYHEDWYGLIYLAHEYYYRGYYQNSINEFNYILSNYSDKYSSLEQASCYLFMGDDYSALKDATNAIDNYIKAINIDPTYREPYLGLASVYLSQNNYQSAINTLKEALSKTYRHYTWLERDTSWTYEIYDLLCLANYYGGNKKDSIIYAAKALYYEPENDRLKNNLKLCIENTPDSELI